MKRATVRLSQGRDAKVAKCYVISIEHLQEAADISEAFMKHKEPQPGEQPAPF